MARRLSGVSSTLPARRQLIRIVLFAECPKLGLGKSLSLWLCLDLGWQGLSMIVIEIGLWASC